MVEDLMFQCKIQIYKILLLLLLYFLQIVESGLITQSCYKKKLACKIGWAELNSYTTLWGDAIKTIEGSVQIPYGFC